MSFFDSEEEVICPKCGADLKMQWAYFATACAYKCSDCGSNLHRRYSSDPFKIVSEANLCPSCGANLYAQFGYSDGYVDWTCEECEAELHRDEFEDVFEVVDDEEYEDEYEEDEEDEEIQKRLRIKAARKKEKRKRLWRTLIGKKQQTGISSEQCRKMHYSDVIRILEVQEFFNIRPIIIEDLTFEEISKEGIVEKISINGDIFFGATTRFPYSSDIVITYHMLKKQSPAMTSREAKKRKVTEVVSAFAIEGFVNIKKIPLGDLKFGLLSKENSVESVTIDGRSDFKKKDKFRIDSIVQISYHTFAKKK